MVAMSQSRAFINNYIIQKRDSINTKYRLKFHMSCDVGWMNDPNGLVLFNNQYHLYYQAFPFRTKPGQMMWGHFVSNDLVSFVDKGIALSLDTLGEHAFSGGSIVVDNHIHIYYTLHTEKNPQLIRYDGDVFENYKDETFTEEENEKRKHQERCNETKDIKEEDIYHSSSIDGEEFEKGNKVFDNESLPKNINQEDFRDPNPVKIGDTYYIFVGGKDNELNKGIIIVLKSKSLDHFEYAFTIGPFYELGDMAECPSYFRIDDKDVLLVSGCNTYRRDNDFKNINCSVFIVGNIDFIKGTMHVDFIKEIDKGDTFYAPQFIREENRPIMIGWLEMWAKNYPTSLMHHGYVGAFSFPRMLTIKDNDIYQNPVKELDKYTKVVKLDYLPRQADISMDMPIGSAITIKGDNGELLIKNDIDGLSLDNRLSNGMFDCIRRTNHRYDNCHLRILLDTSSIELFINDGKEAISSRFYIDGTLHMENSEDIKNIVIKEVDVK